MLSHLMSMSTEDIAGLNEPPNDTLFYHPLNIIYLGVNVTVRSKPTCAAARRPASAKRPRVPWPGHHRVFDVTLQNMQSRVKTRHRSCCVSFECCKPQDRRFSVS